MPHEYVTERTDADGKKHKLDTPEVVNPPILPEFEQRINAAANKGDDVEVARVTAEYREAQLDHAKELDKREQEEEKKSNGKSKEDSPNES